MTRMSHLWLVLATIIASGAITHAADEPLKQIQTIALDGVEGRIDHFAINDDHSRLYVAALGNNTVEVIDLKAFKRIAAIDGLQEPQGLGFVTGPNMLVVASGQDGKCRFYDQALKLIGAIDGLDDADNVRYDQKRKQVYVGFGSGALAVIDPAATSLLAEIKLDGHPESFQLESKRPRIYVNVPTAGHIAVVDRDKNAVITTWPVKEAQANFPMALDEEHHRLFVGCRKPAKMLVLDTENGKTIAALDCCGDTDDIFYDAILRRLYLSGGDGAINVFEQTDPDHYKLISTIPTAPGARTSFFAHKTRMFYVAVPHRRNQRAEVRVYSVEAPK